MSILVVKQYFSFNLLCYSICIFDINKGSSIYWKQILQILICVRQGSEIHQISVQAPLVLDRLVVLAHILVVGDCLDDRGILVEHLEMELKKNYTKISGIKILVNSNLLLIFHDLLFSMSRLPK